MANEPESTLLLRRIAVAVEKLAGMLPVQPQAPRQAAAPSYPSYPRPAQRQAQRPVPHIAPDSDLDSQYGDPEVRAKDPRDWTGDSMKGLRFSECPAEYLDLVAARLDYFAGENEAEGTEESIKKARYNRLDASRARGWAQRIGRSHGGGSRRAETPPLPGVASDFDDSEIPF